MELFFQFNVDSNQEKLEIQASMKMYALKVKLYYAKGKIKLFILERWHLAEKIVDDREPWIDLDVILLYCCSIFKFLWQESDS